MAISSSTRGTRALKRRRIIERPRLFALLDGSQARVRTLVASAGYGKTTLAEQWVGRDDRRAAWYTARRSSTDVAALSLGVARAAATLFPGCDERLREHLRAVPNPGEHVEVLAEILGEELSAWSTGDWLVLDDYQELAAAAEAERFVAELLAACPIQLLVASRQRPAWASERSILYGETLELNQTALAMDPQEAAEVLGDRGAPVASGLVALANGWPAVIGLASVSSAEIEGESAGAVPESLYRFFAEEVFDALGEDVRAALATLAIAPILDRELANDLLGADEADALLSAVLEVGILVERDSRLDIHPLARAFVEERSEQLGLAPEESSKTKCLEHYRRRRDWDAAFDVISRHEMGSALEQLLLDALDDLLETARLSTVDDWCTYASDKRLHSPLFAIARAETRLRQGRLTEAQSFAEAAALPESSLRFRALTVGGRAAHLASREEDGLDLYERAEVAAANELDRRDALWGQFVCAVELEKIDVGLMLDDLSSGVRYSDPRDFVRAAAHRLMYQLRFGAIDLSQADSAWELVNEVGDPLVRSAFENVYAHALALSARYEEALDVARALQQTAGRYRLDFAVPYALASAGIAHAGLREWRDAERCLDDASARVRASNNRYAEQVCYSVRVRVLAQQGMHEVALALPVPRLTSSLRAIRAEVRSSRALVLACAGRSREALAALKDARGSSTAVEQAVLGTATAAIVALRNGNEDATEKIEQLEERTFSTGALDLLVSAYRSAPDLLATLLRSSKPSLRVADLVRRVRDEDLVRPLGENVVASDDPIERLSKREREVYDLLCQSLSNRKIAEILFISEGTAKLHTHHIFEKLDVHSRTALAVQAALRRSGQATSATGISDKDASS